MSSSDKYKDLFGSNRQSQVFQETFKTKVKATQEDAEYYNRINNGQFIKAGTEIFKYTDPTPGQEWERFIKYNAQCEFEDLQTTHFTSKKEFKQSKFNKLLDDIYIFIEKAEDYNIKHPVSLTPYNANNEYQVYLWLTKDECNKSEIIQSHLASKVYGKYVLFKEWLEQQLEIWNKPVTILEILKRKPKVKMTELALLCYYKGMHVDIHNADAILEPYKSHGLNSSEALVDKYNKYSSRANRTGTGTSKDLKLSTRAKYIESVIKMLEASGDSSEEAKTDLLIIEDELRNNTEN